MNERIKKLAMQSGFKVDWQHEDRKHYCPSCMSGKCTTRNKL